MTVLQRIAGLNTLSIPKEDYSREQVTTAFGNLCGETQSFWLVPCSHEFNPPATEKTISETEVALGYSIPCEYRKLLQFCDGAKLFVAPTIYPGGGGAHIRYHLFGCAELLKINRFLLSTFLSAYADDPTYKHINTVNYMAFNDAADDNYTAIVLNGPSTGCVFLLSYEFQGCPYCEAISDYYYTIADSLESWFHLLLATGGWGGRGALVGSL